MIEKLKKQLIKWFMPSAPDVAQMATTLVTDFINKSGKEDVIAKYGTLADEFTKIQSKITAWLRDGKIDEAERDELYRALLPLAERIVKEVTR